MPSLTILRIALANFYARRARFALTIVAVALSVALVVSITSGYASLERAIHSYVDDYVGSTDFEITDRDDPRPSIPPEFTAQLRADPRVSKLARRVEAWGTPLDADGKPLPTARAMLIGVDDPSSAGRSPKMDAGRFLLPNERDAIVVDENTLETLNKKIGDTVTFGGLEKPLELKIVGVVHKPALMKAFFRSGYVSLEPLLEFVVPDRPGYSSKLRGEFAPNVDGKKFIAEWTDRLTDAKSFAKIKLVRDNREQLDRNLLGLRLASYLGSTVSLGAAAFIILATLMTGVQEQRRQLAMLRAVGATRFQVARLVTLEGLAVGITGAIVGIPLGVASLYIVSLIFSGLFESGIVFAPSGMIYALIVAGLASFFASIAPAIAASRAKPIEAMAEAGAGETGSSARLPWIRIALGLTLASIDSLLIFGPLGRVVTALGIDPERTREIRLFSHFFVGLPSILLGALFFAPLVVYAIELLGRAVLPRLLGLPPALLRQQLTESTWRSAATGVAMMIGLMLLITMNSQGRSALGAWKIPNKFPDVFIVPDIGYGSVSIKPAEIESIKKLPQVEPGRVMAIGVAAPLLAVKLFDIAGAPMPDKTLFIGIDPAIAFDMLELDFRSGDVDTAKRMLLDGREITLRSGEVVHGTIENESPDAITLFTLDGKHRFIARMEMAKNDPGKYVIVTEEFRKLRGYDVGSTFELDSGTLLSTKIDFTIVGVVWSPGIDVMLNTFDLPANIKQQTAATAFGSFKEGQESFGMRDAFALAADLKLGVPKEELVSQMSTTLGRQGLKVADIRELKHNITKTFERLLFFASTVAWLAMLVASLGVGSALVAGIRTRQWRLGVLRSIGLTRAELLRLLLAEAMLLSLVGVALGVGFGLLLSMNAKHLYSIALGFDPPLLLPWDIIGIASAAVMLLGLIATIIPAAMTARREPLSLLQAGRAST